VEAGGWLDEEEGDAGDVEVVVEGGSEGVKVGVEVKWARDMRAMAAKGSIGGGGGGAWAITGEFSLNRQLCWDCCSVAVNAARARSAARARIDTVRRGAA
jgi:hypothetical protein